MGRLKPRKSMSFNFRMTSANPQHGFCGGKCGSRFPPFRGNDFRNFRKPRCGRPRN